MRMAVKFSQTPRKVEVSFCENRKNFALHFQQMQIVTQEVGGEFYQGAYVVIPTVEGLDLPTKGKQMKEDVTVCGIPVYEASNTSGGTTVYIANEIQEA